MQLHQVPPLEKVQEIVTAVDAGINVVHVQEDYFREIQGKFYAWITRPQQYIFDEYGNPTLPEACITLDPAHDLDEGAILGEFARAAADLLRMVQEKVAIANAAIEP